MRLDSGRCASKGEMRRNYILLSDRFILFWICVWFSRLSFPSLLKPHGFGPTVWPRESMPKPIHAEPRRLGHSTWSSARMVRRL